MANRTITRQSPQLDKVLYHFSEDPTISHFVPHVPATNPTEAPAVWAIDVEHEPLYWFPRNCPRVAAWRNNSVDAADFRDAFHTVASRIHAIELGWLHAVRTVQVYRYTFDARPFVRRREGSGQWISFQTIEPVDVAPMGDLLDAHANADIALHLEPSLWPIHDLAKNDRWHFSIVRMSNARPRP